MISVPRFSIIITCYNQCNVITEAVDSALAQECRAEEIIVVDDGSTDGSVGVLEKYGQAITLMPLGLNGGADRARNCGAAVARAEFLVFLDGDDRLFPWALNVYRRVAVRKKPKLILASMHFFRQCAPVEAAPGGSQDIRVVTYEDYLKKDRSSRPSASAMIIERQTFTLAGGWTDGTFPADDQDLLLKLGCAGTTVQIASPRTIAYRIHDRNATLPVRPLLKACDRLLRRERAGEYPGGPHRRFARKAVIGGFVFFLVQRAWRSGCRREGCLLLSAGWPMVYAAIVRRSIALAFGRRPDEILPAADGQVQAESPGPTRI